MTLTTDTTQRPDTSEMLAVHRVFRREFVAMPVLVRGVADGDTARARVVAEHVQLMLDGLHMHHTGEDVVMWPLLLQRSAPSTELVETMQAQHERVDQYAAEVAPLLRSWRSAPTAVDGERLGQLLGRFAAGLFEHLDLEEREILPLAERHLTVAEWDSMGDHGRDAMSARQLPLMFGALLEEADDRERAIFLAHLAMPVRLVMRTVGTRQYHRYISRVRAV